MADRLGSDRGVAFRWRWALPLVPIAASMFCLSALVYYHTAMGGTGEAWGFFQGAVVALYQWLGFVPTFMFWLLLFVWCSIWFVTGRWEAARTRLTWIFAFTLCIAILVNLGTPKDPLPPHAGFVGTYVAVRLTSVIGHALGALLAVAAALASLLLATDFLFYRYFEALARGRVADEVGVEPEATDAFRELAFTGVYSDEPRAGAAPVATSGVVEPTSEPAASDVAAESDLVVRPRWRRRDRASPTAVAEASAAADVDAPTPAASPSITARGDGDSTAFAVDEGVGEDEVVVVDEVTEGLDEVDADEVLDADADETAEAGEREPSLEADEADETDADESDAGDVSADDPLVAIPRGVPPRQGVLFPHAAAAAAKDVDRAAREVLAAGRASITILRRHLGCSASEAMELLDALRANGVVDGEPGTANGRVLTTLAEWEAR